MYLEIFLADFAVFCVFLRISRDFAEIPEFRGSATARNIRSPVQNSAQNTISHWRFGDMYRRPGLLTITWVNWKFGWKIKCFVPFCLESVRKYRLSFEAMQFLYFFWSGTRFSKVTIINGPSKLSPFTLKIEVLIVLHLT